MKYYLEYKDRKEFDEINNYYKASCNFVAIEKGEFPPAFIIENNKYTKWKPTWVDTPADTKKITFEEWKEMINPLEWKEGAYVRYLGTKEGKNSGSDWGQYFNTPGLKAGDIGIIIKIEHNLHFFIKDNIRATQSGRFLKEDLQLITKKEYEAGLRKPTKTYKFNEGDLVIVTKFHDQIKWINGPFSVGEIIKLGGQYWNTGDHTAANINNFKSIAFISKRDPDGNGYTHQTNTEFRHCTTEEIAYFNKIGLGANINDMNKPFDLDTYVPKGALTNIPKDIIKVMLERQVEQGNFEDVTVFEKDFFASKNNGGFIWKDTIENRCIWENVQMHKFEAFYEFHKKAEPKTDDSWKIAVHTDNNTHSRPWVIDFLLKLPVEEKIYNIFTATDKNKYYFLQIRNKIIELTASLDIPKGYKVIEEKDLPNYPEKEDTLPKSQPISSSLDLKWAVKHSEKIGVLLSNFFYGYHSTIYKYSKYKYLVYPQYHDSCMYDTIPSDYIEISEQEAIDRLNAVINGTPLILTASPLIINETNVQNESMLIVPINKKQSITEQLWQVIEKEPSIINDISIFPKKRKSIINNLNF